MVLPSIKDPAHTETKKKKPPECAVSHLREYGRKGNGWLVMERSPIILTDFVSTTEILQWIAVSAAPPLPHQFKIISPWKQNFCKHLWLWTLHVSACLRWPLCGHVKSLMLLQGIQERECDFSPEVSLAPTGLSFPSIHPHAKLKPTSPHHRITCTWQELVKYETEKFCSKSRSDFS